MKQYFVRYRYIMSSPSGYQGQLIEDYCIYKSNISPIDFMNDLKKFITKPFETDVEILSLNCLGDFQTEEEKAIEKEAIGKIREEMHKSLR